jgi:hypothetical protein
LLGCADCQEADVTLVSTSLSSWGRLRFFLVVVCVVASSAGVALAAPSPGRVAPLPATGMTPGLLRAFAVSVHHPVYWAGRADGYTYEVTQTSDGRVYVRYLPSGVKVGDRRSSFLVVGTYPLKNAFAVTQAAAKGVAAVPVTVGKNGTGFLAKPPKSFYFAYPRTSFQIEVYSVTPGRAQQLAVSGKVVPVA